MTEQQPPQDDPNQPYGPPAGQPHPGQPYPQPHPGQPYPGQPYTGQPYPGQRPPSKALAITALVLAILGFLVVTAIAAVVLAIISLVQSRGGRKNGRGMAISALVVALLWIIGAIVVVVAVVNTQAERDSSGQVVEAGNVLVGSIREGDCLAKEPSTSIQLTVRLVPCSDAHREEAFANFDLPDGDFPGQAEVDRLADTGCFERFEAYVGIAPEDTRLRVVFLRPDESTWEADPEVTCLVSEGTLTTGSLKGANR